MRTIINRSSYADANDLPPLHLVRIAPLTKSPPDTLFHPRFIMPSLISPIHNCYSHSQPPFSTTRHSQPPCSTTRQFTTALFYHPTIHNRLPLPLGNSQPRYHATFCFSRLRFGIVKASADKIGGCERHNPRFSPRDPAQPPISTTKNKKWRNSGVVNAPADKTGGCESEGPPRRRERAVVNRWAIPMARAGGRESLGHPGVNAPADKTGGRESEGPPRRRERAVVNREGGSR